MTVWGEHKLKCGEQFAFAIGPLSVWVRRSAKEWVISHTYSDAPLAEPPNDVYHADLLKTAPPEDLDVERWASPSKGSSLIITPVMPNRPVVARPNTPIQLLPSVTIDLYVRIPVSIQFSLSVNDQEKTLFELPVTPMSNTWFGDPVHGELCYSIATRALTEPSNVRADMSKAVCRVRVTNASKTEVLDFSRLCIRAPFLALFNSDNVLWANNMSVVFKGIADISDVRYGQQPPGPPLVSKDCSLISPPRQRVENVLKRSFAGIQSWLEC